MFTNHRVKFASVLLAHHLRLRHLFLRFDPIMACNLRCTMCYFSNDEYLKQVKGAFSEAEIHRIADLFFRRTLQLVIGCATEPTLYKGFPEIVRLAKDHKIPFVGFTSNGQLLNEEHIRKFIEYKLDELTLSVHGVHETTYETFMPRSAYATFHRVLQTLQKLKKDSSSSLPHLRMNYTVNNDNLTELGEFFSVFGDYDISTLQIRPIIDFAGKYREPLSSDLLPAYRFIVGKLADECKKRNIVLLADKLDPTYESTNYTSLILQAVRRHITPQVVWQSDFDWKKETYDAYCKRIRWSNHFSHLIFSPMDEVLKYNTGHWGKHAAKYDVL
jgi:MoaA/NifB/PqqE/SkfB family radical SAM enzyme